MPAKSWRRYRGVDLQSEITAPRPIVWPRRHPIPTLPSTTNVLFTRVDRKRPAEHQNGAFDPTATFAVHCGNSDNPVLNPYQNSALSR